MSQFALDSILDGFPRHRVQFRWAWLGIWVTQLNIQAVSATAAAAPTVPSARLLWHVGYLANQPDPADPAHNTHPQPFTQVTPLDFIGSYVRIQLMIGDDPANDSSFETVWTGVVISSEETILGDDVKDSRTSDQILTCVGFEHLLDRVPISQTYITNDGTNVAQINTVPIFNELYARGFGQLGNRSAGRVTLPPPPSGSATRYSVYVFGSDNLPWTNLNIVENLVRSAAIGDLVFDIIDSTNPSNTAGNGLDAIVTPRLDLEGRSLRQALDKLIDRRRGFGWCLRVFPATSPNVADRIVIWIYSVFSAAVTLGSGTIGPNTEPAQMVSSNEYQDSVILQQTEVTTYDDLYVCGEKLKSCFTLSFKDETLDIGWDASEETAYKTAGGTNRSIAENDGLRNTDQFQYVYSAFKVDDSWNWMVGDGLGHATTKHVANPTLNLDGTVNGTSAAGVRNWKNARQFLRHLPIAKAVHLDANGNPDTLIAEFMEPFALILNPQGGTNSTAGGTNGTYQLVNNHTNPDVSPGALRMLDSSMAFEVRMTPRHAMALNSFPASLTAKPPKLDYNTLIATVCAETDERVRIHKVMGATPPRTTLRIEIPNAEQWYIVEGTITGTDTNGAFVRFSATSNGNTNLVRDDSQKLRDIATAAAAWYGQPRATIAFRYFDIDPGITPVGSLFTAFTDNSGTTPVQTPITSVVYNFDKGETVYQTTYSELDFTLGNHSGVHL